MSGRRILGILVVVAIIVTAMPEPKNKVFIPNDNFPLLRRELNE